MACDALQVTFVLLKGTLGQELITPGNPARVGVIAMDLLNLGGLDMHCAFLCIFYVVFVKLSK